MVEVTGQLHTTLPNGRGEAANSAVGITTASKVISLKSKNLKNNTESAEVRHGHNIPKGFLDSIA
jgi:hypothetical protein